MIHPSHKGMKLLNSYLLTYTAILLIPILAACICYAEAVKMIRSGIESENQVILQQAGSILDEQMTELADFGTQMAGNTVLNSLRSVENPLEYPNIQAYFRMKSSLPLYPVSPGLLYDYFLFFNKGQLALNDRYVYSYDDYYNLYMHSPDQSLEDWKKEMQTVPLSSNTSGIRHAICLAGEKPEEKTLIELTYSFLPYIDGDGQIVLFIDQQKLLELLDTFRLRSDDIAYIESSEGVILAAVEPEKSAAEELHAFIETQSTQSDMIRARILHRDMLISRYQSEQTGMHMIIARSSEWVYGRLNHIYRIIIISLVAAFLLGLLFSFLFSVRNSTFLQKLAPGTNTQKLGEMSYSKAFQSLRQTFDDIQIANDSLEKTLAVQQPYLQKSFLIQLLNGDFPDEEKALAIANNIPSFHSDKPMRVLLLHFSGDSALSGDATEFQMSVNCTAVIRLAIESLEPDSLHASRSESDYVLLLCGNNLEERIEKLVALIRSNIPEEVNTCLFAYAGNPVDKLSDVVRSWDSAASMIYIQPSPDDVPVQYFRENENARFEIFYPQDLQRRLISCMMNADESGVQEILNTLKDRNRRGTEIPTYIAQLLIDSLINTLLQINTMSGLPSARSEGIFNSLLSTMSMPVPVQLDMIDTLYFSLCEAIRQQKDESSKTQVVDDIADYLSKHYMESDLSLTSVANLFHVSESYLSFTFKAQKGINFFSYVEDLRIAKAKSLLRQTTLKISEIAEQSGYASTNSFCRAFKRKTGDSASNYRNGTEE